MSAPKIEAVIFDMDGVIFDTERVVIEGWKKMAERRGVQDIEKACIACIGTNYQKTKEIMKSIYGQDFPYDQYRTEAREIQAVWIKENGLPQKNGVRELLEFLKSKDIKLALASSTRVDKVKEELEDADFLKFFDLVIGGDMVENSKPSPEIFLKACHELSVEPENAWVIEDSYNGIRAAYSAGCVPIMVPDILQPDDEMLEKANYIKPSLVEVLKLAKDVF